MTNTTKTRGAVLRDRLSAQPDLVIGAGAFLLAFLLYVATLAPGLVFGDPAEYTFVPHIWGISHPPGYALMTVLGGIWQRVVPIGSIAYRANLLSAAAGGGIAALVYGSVRALTPRDWRDIRAYAPALVGAGSAATAIDLWQHSIHANSHILTALLASGSVFALLGWWKQQQPSQRNDRWLYAFCVLAGLSATHHPLLAFSFPAYTAFIIAVRPRILLDWQTLTRMVGFALIGLSVWLYLPLRAAIGDVGFGPSNTNTLNGFLDLVLARGLTVNLFHFGLADQVDRTLVFVSLLRLQASWIVIALMVIGLVWLWCNHWRVGLLFSMFLGVNLIFILNTIQDVMAYLMTPFAALMMLAGIGAIPVIGWMRMPAERDSRLLRAVVATVLVAIPVLRAVNLMPLVSLRQYTAAQDWIDEVYERFEGEADHAVLLAHWEHLTPLWYEDEVEGRHFDEEDLTLVFVATTSKTPWVDNTWANIDKGPIYVSGYQRELIDAGFRLRPVGAQLYRVIPAPAKEPATMQIELRGNAGAVDLVGVDLPRDVVYQGDVLPLSIAMQADETLSDIIFPYVKLGDVTYLYTTDSHWLTPYWQPGETIVERYDLRAPFTLAPGQYPLKIGLRNLSQGGDALAFPGGTMELEIATITILEGWQPDYAPEALLADIEHQYGLISARASGNGQRRTATWDDPIVVHPGDDIHVRLNWASLSTPAANMKVYVHLVGPGNEVIAQQDAPPLGGAFPTWLWFPKWVPGETVIDPYRLTVPEEAPPGDYRIEVGMYHFMTFQRALFYDVEGAMTGDFFVLGMVRVEP
jgi:hypothetical protein